MHTALFTPISSESHAQRTLRLRGEFTARYARYARDPAVKLILDKLRLAAPSADNSLSDQELDVLDRIMDPIRRLKARKEHVYWRS